MIPGKIILTGLTLLALTGCAGPNVMSQGLPLLKGKSIDTAIDYMGLPDAEKEIAGRKIYEWNIVDSGTDVRPAGHGGIAVGVGSHTHWDNVWGMDYVAVPYINRCLVKAEVDQRDIIQSVEYRGNYAGCDYFRPAMQQLITDYAPPPAQTAVP